MSIFSVKTSLENLNNVRRSGVRKQQATAEFATPTQNALSAEEILVKLDMHFEFIAEEAHASKAIDFLDHYQGILGCDIETTPLPQWIEFPKAGLDPYLSKIRTVQFATETHAFVFDLNHISFDSLRKLWTKPLVFHNATFDVKFLLKAGAYLERVGCTQSMTLILSGGGKWKSLAQLAKEKLNVEIPKDLQLSDWSRNVLSHEQFIYAALDAVIVKRLCSHLLCELKNREMLRITSIIQKAIPAVAAMELAGIPFDWEARQLLIAEWENEATSLSKCLVSTLAIQDMSSMKEIQERFADYFSKNGYNILQGKNGLPKLGKKELGQFKDNPLIAKYLEYSCLKTRLSTFGVSLRERAHPITNRIHPMFLHGRASTGRFATSNPNTQNFPNGSFRALIKPTAERIFVVADYSQIELRLIAIVAEEENMLAAYREGKDLHRLTASKLLNLTPEKITKEQRTCAKAVNFGFIYGQRENGFIRVAKNDYGLEIPLNLARRYREAFFQAYPAIESWHQKIAREIGQTGIVRTLNGWERNFNHEIRKMMESKEEGLKRKKQQIDSQRSKLLSEEQILQRHRTRINTNPDSAHTQELLMKKELYVNQLRKKLHKIEQEKRVLNVSIENAKREKNILYVPKILGEKNNILFAAYNLPIQGLGCELMAVALTKTYYGLTGTSAQIINCVHDEIVIECDKIEARAVSEILRDSMLNAFSEMFPSYINTGTGLVDTKIAKNWGEAK